MPDADSSNPILACPDCDQLHRYQAILPRSSARCSCCGATLYRHRVDSVGRTLALALAGLILFIPANVYPVMTFHFSGGAKDNFLPDGPWELWEGGLHLVALLVLWTSIVAPVCKLGGLSYLLWPMMRGRRPRGGIRVLKALTWIEEWAMLDVYLLGMLVCAVKLGALGHITTSTGLYALLAVILISLATSLSFDRDTVWRQWESMS